MNNITYILLLLMLILSFNTDATAQPVRNLHSDGYISQPRNQHLLPLKSSDTVGVWMELHPNIPRVYYWGVCFIDADNGFAVGDSGAIIKTTNGGQNWRYIETGMNTDFRTIGSYDGEVIVAAGNGGKMIISTDYGESWQNLPNVVNQGLRKIQFITKQVGWLVGGGSSALKTTDGGYTWANQPTPGGSFFDVSFLDTSFGYICAGGGRILRTTDGGTNWHVYQVINSFDVYTVAAVTPLRGVAAGQHGMNYLTTDGGETWQNTGSPGPYEPFKIVFTDTLNGFLTGFGGSFVTTNGGFNWVNRIYEMEGLDITFANGTTGYIVGPGMLLRKTTNSGQNWFKTVINDHFSDVFFTSENNGWFIGRHVRYILDFYEYTNTSSLYQTLDGGKTLIARDDFPEATPSSVYFLDSLTGIVGAGNKMFKTIDGGVMWKEKNIGNLPGNGGNFDRIFFIDDNTGWAKSSYIIKTTDAGENWNFQINGIWVTGIHFSDHLNGWVSREGTLRKPLKTTDGGETWIEQTNAPNQTSDVYFKDNLNGVIAVENFFSGRYGGIYKTTNSGTTWSLDSSVGGFGGSGRFSNVINNTIYISGEYSEILDGYVHKSTDKGTSWNEVIELRFRDVRYIRQSQFSEKFDIAIGGMGLVFRFNDSIVVSIGENPVSIVPERYYLKQNFPNPFNAETIIRFTIPQRSHVRITIYDVTGRELHKLINDELNAGHHAVRFDAKDLPSGVYYYRMTVNNYSETKKLVVTK